MVKHIQTGIIILIGTFHILPNNDEVSIGIVFIECPIPHFEIWSQFKRLLPLLNHDV